MTKNVTLEFVCRVLEIFDGEDGLSASNLWWRTDDEYAPITLFVNCNDMFFWACSDCEKLTPENLHILEQAVKDVKAVTGDSEHADLLFCCRVRKMQPQGAVFDEKYLPKRLWSLFAAAGEHRPADLGNPTEYKEAIVV